MSRTGIQVRRDPCGGRPRVTVRSDGPRGRGHIGVRVLSAAPDRVRVALVAEGHLLVAGDEVELGMRVGPGMRLDVVEPSGTVAYDMRGGSAVWRVHVAVDDDAVLAWRAEPFVVSTGAVVDREVSIDLCGTGVTMLCELLVLGRVGETGGVVRQRLRVRVTTGSLGGSAARRPLLAEDLHLDGGHPSVAVLGGHRVVETVSVLGRRAPGIPTPAGSHRFELDGEGTVVRALADAAHLAPLDPVWAACATLPAGAPT